MTSQVATWEAALPGWGDAFRALLDEQSAMDHIEQPRPVISAPSQAGDLRDEDGAFYVMPENEPAVYLWLFHLCHQWDRDAMGNLQGFRSAVALEFARELAATDPEIRTLRLVEDLSVIASTALPLLQAHQQEAAAREAQRQRQNGALRRLR